MALRRIFQLASSLKEIGNHYLKPLQLARPSLVASIHTTSPKLDLSEFFEDKKNWTKDNIQVGRAYNQAELRLKSNSDLHKLWFVLLKEQNMLLTMEHFYKQNHALFPNPERIDKVKISMQNLEEVVRERNRAYWQLEVGESGERPGEERHNQIGLRFFYRKFEHNIPCEAHKKWARHHTHQYRDKEVRRFLLLLNEKRWQEKRRALNRNRRAVRTILRRYPDVDREALAAKYPDVDADHISIQRSKEVRPHKYIPPESS
ncbi:unnamed protein product [Bemisia tabaci]|uniref:Large ribosomal subunit protein uL29m n=1 Tax=Bemisia tabaci TaxID=7038 RepID=A0A9P0AMM1_BEMTA|nr:PREDICTED: 39S ribosomal protein L47, mitochondrial [Bemisia tabaci]CAH0394835.1 unnamed protein product [Bemisia tabaci]